ncbi:hypothetical protein MMC08_008296 [Hypocenomyce scalaris]|nr:hypothetical protein [Hypocenomyce scalaris]
MQALARNIFTRQPGKSLYILIAVAISVARLPLWLIYYIPSTLRQHPKWTFRQAFMVQILKTLIYHFSIIEMHTPLSLKPGVEQERFVVVHPTKPERYVDVLENGRVKPEKIGGTWYPSPYKIGNQQDVVLHFHGGAYVIGTGRADDAGFPAKMFNKYANAKVFMAQYRLSSNPGGQFPAALQDAVSAYQYLLDAGIPASKIVVSGDSAGGNLALGLLRYLSDHGNLFPSPTVAWLWSPWVNIAGSADPRSVDTNRHYSTDFLSGVFPAWGARTYVPDSLSATHPYISPLDHPFESKTPIWIQTGGVEILYDDNVKLADQLRGIDGNKVELVVEPYAPHDIISVGDKLGFEAEANRVAKKAGEFLENERTYS